MQTMADEKLSNEAQLWAPDDGFTNSKPKLENVALFRVNDTYVPRKYKRLEDDDLENLSVSSDSDSSTSVLENQTAKLNPETKLCSPSEKPVINYVPSIRINVANLSPERGVLSPKKNVVFDEKSISKSKDHMVFGEKELQSMINSPVKPEDTSTNTFSAIAPRRGPGRPRKHLQDSVSHDNDEVPQSNKSHHPSSGARVITCERRVFTRKRTKLISPHSNDNNSVKNGQLLRSIKDNPANDTSRNDCVGHEYVDQQQECNICHKMYSNLTKLQKHMHWHVTRKMFRCGLCKKIFKGFSYYIRHQQMHSKSKESQRDKTPLRSSSMSNDNTHAEKPQRARKTLGNKCSICLRTFSSLGRLRMHQVVHQKGDRRAFKCYVCGKRFVYFGKIKKHVLKCHNIVKLNRWQVKIQSPAYLKCTSCGQTFNSRHDMQIHEKLEHDGSHGNVASTNSEDIIDDEKGIYKCGTCDKNFTLKRTLHVHKALHTGEKPFTCHICNKLFTWRSALLAHFKNYHEEKRPYKCDKCGSLFKMCISLRRHVCIPKLSSCTKSKDDLGSVDGSYKCKNCDRTFAARSSLRMHNTRVHSKRKSKTKPRPSPHQASQSSVKDAPTRSHDTQSCKLSNSKYSLRSDIHEGKVSTSLSKPHDSSSDEESPKHTAVAVLTELQTHEDKVDTKKQSPEAVTAPQRQEWILIVTDNGRQLYRCGLCTHSERNFAAVSSVRKHVGMIHRDFTDILVEPPGLYDNVSPEQTSTSTRPLSSNAPQDPNLSACTCKGYAKEFVYKNDKLSCVPSDCPVHKPDQSSKAKDDQILKCKHCDEEFDRSSREKFMEHELSHELEATEPMGMMYACFECDQEFALANDLMEHHATAH